MRYSDASSSKAKAQFSWHRSLYWSLARVLTIGIGATNRCFRVDLARGSLLIATLVVLFLAIIDFEYVISMAGDIE